MCVKGNYTLILCLSQYIFSEIERDNKYIYLHMYIYIYIYMCVCVCVCERKLFYNSLSLSIYFSYIERDNLYM